MKRLAILGSTGSIGRNVLRIVDQFPDRFSVVALAAGRNVELLSEQVKRFLPEVAVVIDDVSARGLEEKIELGCKVKIFHGKDGYEAAATIHSADMVVSAMSGAAGLLPTLAAIESGRPVALANKESLVMAGEILMQRALDKNVAIVPIDSEHSAIFQCLVGHRKEDLDQILLTASGGPFLEKTRQHMERISPETALRHPTWEMGPKVTIDSATLMNKGLEVIEAKWLFDVPLERIRVVIHPESVVHSMVVFRDGSVMAQLALPDMRVPIAYALSYPERLSTGLPAPDFVDLGALTFREPDLERFPCLALAMEACKVGKTAPAVLNAANEMAVYAFLNHQIGLYDIAEIVRETLSEHTPLPNPALSDILSADVWARRGAEEGIHRRLSRSLHEAASKNGGKV